MIGVEVSYLRAAAIVDPIEIQAGRYEADIDYIRIAAIINLVDAQGWEIIDNVPRYVAEVERIDIRIANLYTLVVDRINLSDNVGNSDSTIFSFTKLLNDNLVAVDIFTSNTNKPFSDNIIATDPAIFSAIKPFDDNAICSDATVFNTTKVTDDSVITTESAIFNMVTPGSGSLNEFAIDTTPLANEKKTIKVF